VGRKGVTGEGGGRDEVVGRKGVTGHCLLGGWWEGSSGG
jgi:hypothetical protein